MEKINKVDRGISPVSLEDIIGKEDIVSIIDNSFKNIEASIYYLLIGLPGSGKTFILNYIASNMKQYSVSYINSCELYVQVSPLDLLRQFFRKAKPDSPSILLLDEIDVLFSTEKRLSPCFLQVLKDELSELPNNVLFIASTAVPWMIQPEALNIFSKVLYCRLPNAEQRALFINHFFKESLTVSELHYCTENTENYSFSDLTVLAKDVLMNPIREILKNRFYKVQDGMYYKAKSSDEGVIEIDPTSIQWDKFFIRKVNIEDIKERIAILKPSMRESDFDQIEGFYNRTK